MKPALTSKKPAYPGSWDELPVGQQLKQHVQDSLLENARRFFGYHLVKIGCLSKDTELPTCTIRHVVNVVQNECVESGDSLNQVVADAHELPFSENSVDAFLLVHELDFSRDPHQILREVDRAIIPNGNVVIVGFNPFSLAGLLRFLPFRKNKMLRDARFFSSMRINDWLQLLGFELVEQHQLVFSSLLLKRKFRALGGIERLCRKYLPIFSSVYVIVAKKRVIPLSPIKPKWKLAPKFSPARASMRDRVDPIQNKITEKNLL